MDRAIIIAKALLLSAMTLDIAYACIVVIKW